MKELVLIDAGAFDEFDISRATLKKNLKQIMDYARLKPSLVIDEKPILKIVPDDMMVKLNREKEVLGLYLSMHPIQIMKNKVKVHYINLSRLEHYVNKQINIIIQVQRVKNITDRKGNEMCFVDGIDDTGSVDCVIFSSVYKNVALALQKGNICIVQGKVDYKDKLSFVVEKASVIK